MNELKKETKDRFTPLGIFFFSNKKDKKGA